MVQNFSVIGSGVWILWGVERWTFPLHSDVAVNTVWTTVHTTILSRLVKIRSSVAYMDILSI